MDHRTTSRVDMGFYRVIWAPAKVNVESMSSELPEILTGELTWHLRGRLLKRDRKDHEFGLF